VANSNSSTTHNLIAVHAVSFNDVLQEKNFRQSSDALATRQVSASSFLVLFSVVAFDTTPSSLDYCR